MMVKYAHGFTRSWTLTFVEFICCDKDLLIIRSIIPPGLNSNPLSNLCSSVSVMPLGVESINFHMVRETIPAT